MMMDVLERSPETDVYHERDPRAFNDYQMRELSVVRGLHRRSPAPFFVIKALCEADRIGELLDLFAPARALWMIRRVDDVVHSAVRSFRNFPAQIERLARGGEDWDWRARGLSAQTQQHLRQLYHPGLTEPNGAALMWYVRNVLFFERGLDHDSRVMLVSYEDLVSDPNAQLGHLFRFLGLGYTPRYANAVSSAAVGRRGQADLEPDIRALCKELEARFHQAAMTERAQI